MTRLIIAVFFIFLLKAEAQHTGRVDFTHGRIEVEIIPEEGRIVGQVAYDFRVDQNVDSLIVSSRDLEIESVLLDNTPLTYSQSGRNLVIEQHFSSGTYKDLLIRYKATPRRAVYFPGWNKETLSGDPAVIAKEGGAQVWTQGQGKYTSSWVPSFDDMNEKVIYSINLVFPSGFSVVASGVFKGRSDLGDKTLWKYAMKKPVSAYVLAFTAGRYEKEVLRSGSGVPLELYYYPQDSARFETTYRYTVEIFDFLEKEIGEPYPWKVYRQVPVRDFLYAGMENVTLTIFSDSFVTDSIAYNDRNYVNVNAHELAHHWFGNLVTEESGKHHWLQEGFATYYALLAERELFGEDYYYWKLYKTATQLSGLSDDGKGEALLNPGAGSLTFYEKGAWALHILRERIGDEAFQKGIKQVLKTYGYRNLTTAGFLEIMQKCTTHDLSEFRKTWLEDDIFPEEEVRKSLEKSAFIRKYLQVAKDEAAPVVVFNEYATMLKDDWYFPLKHLIVKKASSWPSALRDSLWLKALNSGDLRTRQGVALAADSVGTAIKEEFETLLQDESYITIQEALMKLWIAYPDDREEYLLATENYCGFEDRSLRVLWLGLALFTPEMGDRANDYYEELEAYTGPGWQFETRQQAFNMLFEIGGFSKRSLLNLIQGFQHPAWQFSRFCKTMFDRLMLKPEMRIQVRTLLPEVDEETAAMLRNKLDQRNNGSN